jgi:DNA-binding CsgD family transcriptional regulator
VHPAIEDITDFAVSVLDEMTAPAFPAGVVLATLSEPLDAPAAVYQRTRWQSGETRIAAYGCSADDLRTMVETSRLRRTEHPLMVATAHGRLAPTTAERAAGGADAWRQHPVRRFLTDLGGWQQMASVGLRGGGTEICGLAFARPGRDFTGADLALLATVQPLLQAVERHAVQMERWRADLGESADSAARGARDAGLTAREISVLALLGEGLTAAALARRLGCSPRTVGKHCGALYRKLGVNDRLSAVLEGQRRGLLPDTPARAAPTPWTGRVPTPRDGRTDPLPVRGPRGVRPDPGPR